MARPTDGCARLPRENRDGRDQSAFNGPATATGGAAGTGLALLGVAADETPAQIVAAVTDYVRDAREQGAASTTRRFALGALIGAQYVRGLGWHWGDVTWDGDPDSAAVGVLSPDESLFNNPIGWVSQIAESGGGVPFMLSYNMILANQVPLFERGSATGLY